jgi:hypothetical protein
LHPGVSHRLVRSGMTVSALCMAIFGAMLLFAPNEVSRLLLPDVAGPVLVQLLGAALLGGASANWTARGSALGGIYGRAVVVGNQTHLTIGALLLLNGGLDLGADHPAYWLLTVLYVVGAAFFIYLTFFSSGLREN